MNDDDMLRVQNQRRNSFLWYFDTNGKLVSMYLYLNMSVYAGIEVAFVHTHNQQDRGKPPYTSSGFGVADALAFLCHQANDFPSFVLNS